MKTLIIVSHPDIENSTINKHLVEEAKKYPEKYTIHELNVLYPDGKIDVEQEQKLVEEHGNIVLQFPFFWFNCPPLIKKWLDDVLTHGWAYGSHGGDKFVNRKVALAVSTGIKDEDYSEQGRYHYTLEQLLVPFETTFRYVGADYRPFFAFYGAEYQPSEDLIEKGAHAYISFLNEL